MKSRIVLLMLLLAASLAFAAQTADLPFGEWRRASETLILSPQGATWESAGTFNPATVLHNGKIVMLYRAQDASGTSRLGYAESTDGIHFTRRPGKFDSRVVEPGPPPILTERGIVLIYNAADDNLVYRTAVAVFDRNDPRKLLSRSDAPIFSPEKDWEKVGQVPNVVFIEGIVLIPSPDPPTKPVIPSAATEGPDPVGRNVSSVLSGTRHSSLATRHFFFYYGAADKYIGVAEAPAK